MEPVDRIKKEQRPDPIIQIIATRAKGFKRGALLPEFVHGKIRAGAFQRLVAQSRVSRSDDTDQVGHDVCPGYLSSRRAKSSTRPLITSSRSSPSKASAN